MPDDAIKPNHPEQGGKDHCGSCSNKPENRHKHYITDKKQRDAGNIDRNTGPLISQYRQNLNSGTGSSPDYLGNHTGIALSKSCAKKSQNKIAKQNQKYEATQCYDHRKAVGLVEITLGIFTPVQATGT